jgi:hypothetical protein
MQTKSSFILSFLTLAIIIVSSLLGYLDVISALFYFVGEIAVMVIITMIMHIQFGNIFKAIQIGIMSIFPLAMGYLLAYFPVIFLDHVDLALRNEVYDSSQFLPYMLKITWPFILIRLITSIAAYFLTPKDIREETVMNNLFTPIFLILGIGVTNIALLNFFDGILTANIILVVILSIRFIVELIQYKSILGIGLRKHKKQP